MKAVIFDFDGVIVDSERYWDQGCLAIYQTMLPQWTTEDDKQLKGRSVHDIYPWLVKEHGLTLTKDEYMGRLHEFVRTIYEEQTQMIDGILELLEALQARRIPLAIASSSQRNWIDMALARFDIGHYFRYIVVAQDVGRGKPDPAVYIEAARRLDVPADECIAIEDSTNGLKSAKAADMFCIALQHLSDTHPQDLSAAHMIVTSLRDIGVDELFE